MKSKSTAVIVIISFIGLGSLYCLSLNVEPHNVSIGEIDEMMVGRLVQTSGVISRISLYDNDVVFELINSSEQSQISVSTELKTIFLLSNETRSKFQPGAEIMVTGVVSEYQGRYEITVSRPESFRLLTCESKPIRISALLDNPELFNGLEIPVEGIIVYGEQSAMMKTFYLIESNGTSKYCLSCIYWGSENIRENLTETMVTGSFHYDANTGSWRFNVNKECNPHLIDVSSVI